MKQRKEKGAIGEREAVRLLRRNRYRLLECNYVCPLGEIDIVARQGRTLCFVEVRTRTAPAGEQAGEHGRAVEMINPAKRRQVVRCASYYLHHNRVEDVDVRFDVVGVTLDPDGKVIEREVIPDAFSADEGRRFR